LQKHVNGWLQLFTNINRLTEALLESKIDARSCQWLT